MRAWGQPLPSKKAAANRDVLPLLTPAVGVPLPLPAEGAGDIVKDSDRLQSRLCLPVQPLSLADGLGEVARA